MSISLILALLFLLFAILFGWAGVRRFRRWRMLSGTQFEVVAILLLVLAALFGVISSNLVVYQRLVYEAPVASIQFTQIDAMHYRAELMPVNGLAETYELSGDEWQLDARIIKWKPYASLIGLDTLIRLNRLSGRYARIDQERVASRSVYEVGAVPEVDFWPLATDFQDWLGWLVDSAYGSAVYLPMANAAEYEITVSQSGLVARPVNDEAKQAVSGWAGL